MLCKSDNSRFGNIIQYISETKYIFEHDLKMKTFKLSVLVESLYHEKAIYSFMTCDDTDQYNKTIK